jgi:hypothetical protein
MVFHRILYPSSCPGLTVASLWERFSGIIASLNALVFFLGSHRQVKSLFRIQCSHYFPEFFLGWEGNGFTAAKVGTSAAPYHAVIWVGDNGVIPFVIPLVHAIPTEVETFLAANAFVQINSWIPRDLFPWHTFLVHTSLHQFPNVAAFKRTPFV